MEEADLEELRLVEDSGFEHRSNGKVWEWRRG